MNSTDSLVERQRPAVVLSGALKRIAKHKEAKKLFVMWPSLKQVSMRFCHYTTELLDCQEGGSLIDTSLVSAFEQYEAVNGNEAAKACAYVLGLTSHADQLLKTVIRGRSGRNYLAWMPFSAPIGEWMSQMKSKSIMTTPKRYEFEDTHAQALLIGNILSVEDMHSLGIRLSLVVSDHG